MVKSEKFFKLRITIYEFHLILTVIQPTTDKLTTDQYSSFSIFIFFHFLNSGNLVLFIPSKANKALATAAAVGTRPISPIPFAP